MIGRFPILYIAEADAEDAVLSSGVLAHLVESLPDAIFTIVGSAASAPLFADTPRLTKLIVLEREGHFEWIALWNQVRATKWGLVVDMRGSTLSGKLKRHRRAVRGKDDPALHAVEAAACDDALQSVEFFVRRNIAALKVTHFQRMPCVPQCANSQFIEQGTQWTVLGTRRVVSSAT